MSSNPASPPRPKDSDREATQHLREAHHLLKRLKDKIDEHPELEQAIQKLESALAALTVKSGGML